MIEDVTEDSLRILKLMLGRKDQSGGDHIVESKYDAENKMLFITYESNEVAQRVFDFGDIQVKNKTYKPKRIPPENKPQEIGKCVSTFQCL